MPKPGRIGLGYFADDKGRIVTEMSIMALDEDFFFLITAAVAEWHDFEWLQKHLPQERAIHSGKTRPRSSTARSCPGPNSRKILAEVCDADLSLPWLSHQSCQIAGRWCQLVRVSFAGELGWEIHTKVDDTATIFDAVWAAGQKHGLKPFGMFALDLLRLEKGYRAWKGICRPTTRSCRAGSSASSNGTSPTSSGKAALLNEKQQGVKKRFVTLVVENPGDCDAPYMSTLWHDGEIVGETTVRRLGPSGGQIDRARHAARRPGRPGTAVEVEIFGERFQAIVQKDEPLWDPKNERLRA